MLNYVGSPQTSYLLGQFMSLQMRLQIELFVLNLLVPAYPLDGSKVWAGYVFVFVFVLLTTFQAFL